MYQAGVVVNNLHQQHNSPLVYHEGPKMYAHEVPDTVKGFPFVGEVLMFSASPASPVADDDTRNVKLVDALSM